MKNFAANWNKNNPIEGVAFNDIYLDASNQLAVVDGVDEIAQTTAQNIQLWKGEFNYDLLKGVPYRLILGNPHIDQSLITLYLKTNIMQINDYMSPEEKQKYGINKIASLSFDENRTNRNTLVELLIRLNNSQSINISTV